MEKFSRRSKGGAICSWPFILATGVPGDTVGKKKFVCQCRRCQRCGLDPWVRKIPWNRKWQPTPVILPGKFHGQRSLVGYCLWDGKESHTTKQLHFSRIRQLVTTCCKVIWQYFPSNHLTNLSPNQGKTGLAIHIHRALSTDIFAQQTVVSVH